MRSAGSGETIVAIADGERFPRALMDCWPSVLSGTKDQYDAGDRYRTLLPDYHFTVVYDAIGAEQPEALAYIALEFFERRDLFLVSRESGMAFSLSEELQAFKFDSRVRNELRAEAMIPVPGCGCRSPPATSTCGSVSGRQHNAARTYTQGRRRT